MKKIFVCDCTLPVLTGERTRPLLAREKNALAQRLDALGVDILELPAVRNIKEDTIIHKTIASGVGGRILAVPAGDSEEAVDAAWEGVSGAEKPMLTIALPISTVQMEYRYHLKENKMAGKVSALVGYAKKKGCLVAFSAGDASRASEPFLTEISRTAVAAGADYLIFCDDAGDLLPEELARKIRLVKDAVTVPVIVSLSDSIHCACANAITALRAGADGVRCAVTGADVLHTGALAAAIAALGDTLSISVGLRETEVHNDISEMLKHVSSSQKPVSGSESAGVILDAESTPAQIGEAVRSLGYDLSADDLGKVCESVARICEKKSSIGDVELEAVIASSAMQAPSTYHLVSYQITSSNVARAMASITLSRGDETVCGVATGDGPIDCCFKAIEQSIGYHYELDDFQIQAVTEGKEALGSALVRLRSQGKLYSGNGLSADIVGASIRAYINALNKIVYEETER
ncbi:MAG: hypothetical protein J6Z79_06570 [Clostridia bacterium]|nr:hypothetical protein [Clostridia bacterium]